MDPAKVTGVTSWPTPTSKREVQGFLGFANFYRRFIKDFSAIAAPLNRLTGLVDWIWTEADQQAFERIKSAITSAPVLAVPNDHDPFKVECDASKFALGAELAQRQNGQWRTIAFLSKSLSPAERNYEIYDREMLALITALDEWRHFLKGAQTQFEIHSDHKNLEYFRKPQRLNPRQARWVLTLQEYDFTLVHRPGRTMGKPDALSRRPDHDIGDDANGDITVLRPEWFRPVLIDSVTQLQRDILKLSDQLEESVVTQLGENGDFEQTEDGLICYVLNLVDLQFNRLGRLDQRLVTD
uniref:Hexose transporter n=1 Tax=Ganoderma boninense TaxID=34458 RepID=A0A5K1K0P7_9APHY|nr:Hexose transporter [Ganoderma boninense]